MKDLTGAVAKTMNMVFADIELSTNEKKKRLAVLQSNLGKVANIPIDEIQTDQNIRKNIDTEGESFLRLVESIKKYGILENIVAELKLSKKEDDYTLVCVAGHRRIMAAKMAGNIVKIPCLLQSYTDKADSVGVALSENLNREGLHCLDVGEGYKSLIDSGWAEDEIANHFCRDIRTIRHYLKMASWPLEIKKIIRNHTTELSTRVLLRQFAYKKFANTADLKAALYKCLEPVPKAKPKKDQKIQKNMQSVLNKVEMKKALIKYLTKKKSLSSVIKNEITKAFEELKLI